MRAEIVPKFYPQNFFVRRLAVALASIQTRDKPSGTYETDNAASLRFVFKRNSSLTVLANYATEIFTRRFKTGGVSLSGSNQFNSDLATDLLASFTCIPGTVLYFGYGSLYEKIKWQGNEYVLSGRFLETKRGFFAKASYLWRL